MNRVLGLQSLEPTDLNFISELEEEFESTSSYVGCQCSICSFVSCKSTAGVGGMFVAI